MKYNETVTEVNRVMSEYDMALTLRQIYYRLVAGGLIPNRRSAYNSLSAQLVTARECGEVDENRIVDRSRRIDDFAFDSPDRFLDACRNTLKRRFVRRFWASQPVYVEVWVEKDALSAVLAGAVGNFNTIVAPSKGYSSYSYLKDATARIDRYCEDGNRAVLLHFADHDPSGLDMSRDLEARLRRYSNTELEVKRIALTYEQVQEHNLIPNPTKLADPRSPYYINRYGNDCWELDAIPPDELVRLARSAVEGEIEDLEAWEEIKDQELAEKTILEHKLENIE